MYSFYVIFHRLIILFDTMRNELEVVRNTVMSAYQYFLPLH